MAGTSDALIFPVGHYAGAFYQGAVDRYHAVLVGAETRRLSDEQLTVWLAARGVPDDEDRRWTREAVEALVAQAGIANAPLLLDQLGELGLVVETVPGTERAIDFAEAHRVVPLLLGLGNTPDEPWRYGIGLFDRPVLAVSQDIYGLWEWAHVDPNLWAACYSHADVSKRAGATDPEETDPEQILTGFLSTLHALLAASAAYLDVALPEPADDEPLAPMVVRPRTADDALVFPIGHYVGAFHAEVNAPLKHRNLRVGVEIERLTEDSEFGVWALAHGIPDRVVERPWTRRAVLDEAERAGIPDPVGALDRLVARGLIAQVEPDRPEAVEFATRHRVQPLLQGLGNSAGDFSTYGIGFLGLDPMVKVDAFGYEIWQRGRTAPNLRALLASTGRSDIGATLRRVQRLLAGNAIYLDASLSQSE
jgi:hypothetical protein